jgi:hypothetical protein
MMDVIKKLYKEILEEGDEPDTAIMNYNTYRKLIAGMGGTKTFISPPGLFIDRDTKLTVEIYDSLEDDEIIVCESAKFEWERLK